MSPRALARSLVSLALSVAVAGVAVAASLAVIAAAGKPPGSAASALWQGAFGDRQQLAGTLEKMIPLVLVALGWIIAFSARRINVGFEGQILVGGTVAAVVGLELHGLPAYLHLPLGILGGVAGGAAYAAIAAWLWARRRVNEIISTLLLNFVAMQLVSWLVRGPLQEPQHGLAETSQILPSARWPRLLSDTALTWDVFYVPLAVAAVVLLLTKTTFGFRLRLTGANEEAARYAGTQTIRVGAYALVLSGALAGLVGSSLILAGENGTLRDNFSANYGFDGIVTALLARNSPLGVLPAALLFAALRQGGGLMEARVGVSQSLVQVTQGLVIVLLAGSVFLLGRRRRSARAPEASESAPTLAEA